MMMKIEAGRYYRTRDGRKVGPMRPVPSSERFALDWVWTNKDGRLLPDDVWRGDGTMNPFPEKQSPRDLIAEWRDEPDLTAITTPFGLLDRDTQEALKTHGGPYEHYYESRWRGAVDTPGAWIECHAYRVKPSPPKPREWWAVGLHLHKDETTARTFLHELNAAHPEMDFGPIIHVREVLPE